MTRQIDGWLGFSNPLSPYIEYDDPAPFVSGTLEHGGREFPIDFLIDTGSDVTTVMPRDAYDLLGDEYFQLDFQGGTEALRIEGIGDGRYVALPFDVVLHLEDQLGNDVALGKRIWIAEPPEVEFSSQGGWALPSILGRDAIRPGDFEVSYINNTVTLIRPDDE